MATKTFEELKQLAIQIRDEKTNKQNTATRVGTAMLEHINKLEQDYYDKTKTDEELKERDDKLTELELKSLTLKSIEPYKSFGYLNTDGTITGINNWKTYNKIPVSEGDSFSAIFGMIPILEGATAVVIFNSEGLVVKTINTTNVNYTFEQDGFLSFCYNYRYDNSYNIIFRETLKKYISEQVGYKKSIKWTAIGDSITAGNQSNTGTSYATFAAGMLGEQVTLQKLGYWGQRIQNVLVTTAFNAINHIRKLTYILRKNERNTPININLCNKSYKESIQ